MSDCIRVSEDLDQFESAIAERFPGSTPTVIEDLSVALKDFNLEVTIEAMRRLRTEMPAHHLMVDPKKLITITRRLHVEREQAIGDQPPRQPTAKAAPLGMKRPDRRTPDQRRRDELHQQTIDWIESLEPTERDRLLEKALLHWPDGEERKMFRDLRFKSRLVREQMVRVSKLEDDEKLQGTSEAAA